MKKLILVPVLALLFTECKSANSQHPSAQYEEKKASLSDMEHDSPLKFLKVTGSHGGNLLSQMIVEGEVTNKATLTSYKNVKVQLTFHDKTGAVLEKQVDVLDEVIAPNSSIEFKYKAGHIKGAGSVSLDIIDAVTDK
jgi:hypothetical protein